MKLKKKWRQNSPLFFFSAVLKIYLLNIEIDRTCKNSSENVFEFLERLMFSVRKIIFISHCLKCV